MSVLSYSSMGHGEQGPEDREWPEVIVHEVNRRVNISLQKDQIFWFSLPLSHSRLDQSMGT